MTATICKPSAATKNHFSMFRNAFQFCVSNFSKPIQARDGKHFKMGWITTHILQLSDLGAAIQWR